MSNKKPAAPLPDYLFKDGKPSTAGPVNPNAGNPAIPGGSITAPQMGVNFIAGDDTEKNTVMLPNGSMVTPTQFKQWIQVQQVQNSFEWKQYKASMQSLGYSKDSEILSVLSKGADYTGYFGSNTTDPQVFAYGVGGPTPSGGGRGSGGPFTQSQTNVSLSSASQSAGIADQVFRQELGRRASDKELQAFQKALNAAQQANPAKTVTSGVSSGSNTTSSTTSKSGFDPARFATEYAQSRPDYAENFAASTFMDRMTAAINNPSAISRRIEGIE